MISSHTVMTTSGTTCYPTPANFIAVERIVHDNILLAEKSQVGLDSNVQWWTNRGAPSDYYLLRTTETQVCLYPSPIATSTGPLAITYYSYANSLSASTDSPWNNFHRLRPYHYLLSLYAAYRGWMVLGDSALASTYYQEYSMGVERLRAITGFGPNFNPNFSAERPSNRR